MELYIAEYLVENGFANDMVSALKILKVASDDWRQELFENISQELARVRKQIRELSERNKPVPAELYALATKLVKQAKDEANTGAVLSRDKPKPKRKTPGYGDKPSKPRDVISSVGTSPDTDRNIIDLRTGRNLGSSSSRDTLTGGIYADRRTAGGRGTNRSRTGGTYGTRGTRRS